MPFHSNKMWTFRHSLCLVAECPVYKSASYIKGRGEVWLCFFDWLHRWFGMTANVIWCTAAPKDSTLSIRWMQPLCGWMAARFRSPEGSNELLIMWTPLLLTTAASKELEPFSGPTFVSTLCQVVKGRQMLPFCQVWKVYYAFKTTSPTSRRCQTTWNYLPTSLNWTVYMFR